MIGDRMDTDVRSGLEAGLRTILVLSGISDMTTADRYPYKPSEVIDSIADLVGHTHEPFQATR
jgi:NagD protein